MVLTAAVAALASANVGGLKSLWSVLAVAFPALSTALATYNALYAFERQTKIYGDAANALLRARADSPDLKPPMDDAAFQRAMAEEKMLLVSVGTGASANANSNFSPEEMNLIYNAATIPSALMAAALHEQDFLSLSHFREMPGLDLLDREVRTVIGQGIPVVPKLSHLCPLQC